jgi:hypothetical protein
MPGDAVKFGEAFVEIHAKIDEYDREIAAVEQRTTTAIDRVQKSAAEGSGIGSALSDSVGSGIQKVIEPTETLLEVIGRILASSFLFGFVSPMLLLIAQAARASARQITAMGQALAKLALSVPVIGPALSATIGAFTVGAAAGARNLGVVATVLSGLIRLVGFLRKAAVVAARAVGAVLSVLVAPIAILASVGALIEVLDKIPGAARSAFNALKNLTFQDIADGIESLATSIGTLLLKIPYIGAGIIKTLSKASVKSGGPDIEAELKANREFVRIEKLKQDARSEAAKAFVKDTALIAAAEAERRRAALIGLSGPDRARQEELFTQQDIARQGADAADGYYQQFLAGIRKNKAQLDAGDITQEAFDINTDALDERRIRLVQANEREVADALIAARAAGAARVREAIRQDAMARAVQMQQINSQILATRLRLEDRSFDAQVETIRAGYQSQILQAEQDGNDRLVARLQQLAQLRIQAVRKAERERWDAQAEEAERGARRIEDRIRSAQDKITRARIELSMPQGPERDMALRLFDIDTNTEAQIDRIQRRIEELGKKQRDILRINGGPGLTSDKGFAEFNALAKQIDALKEQISLKERLRDLDAEVAKQRGAESSGGGRFRQIDVALDLPGGTGSIAAAAGNGVQDRQLKATEQSREILIAIRDNLKEGVPSYLN